MSTPRAAPRLLNVAKTFSIPIFAGGRLITTLSKSNVGEANFTEKTNFRRIKDSEARREGWLDFSPLAAIANQGVFDAALTCMRIVNLIRGDGTKAVIGLSRTTVRLFSNTAGTWSTIGSGYSASGKRWQVVTIGGVLICNNGVDLPFFYEVGDAAVTPMYELREVGVASVGRISEASGFLLVADITEVYAEVLPLFMRGWSTFTSGTTTAKAANFTVVNGEVDDTFSVTTGAGTITATLPTAPPTDFYIWLKKADAGAGSVTTSPAIAVSAVSLTNQNDLALVFWDATFGRWAAVTFPLGVIPADATYTAPPSYITQRLPWAIANSNYGAGEKWDPAFSVLMPAASTTITLPFASSIFIARQTRVAVIGGGALGGVLGGQEGYENGILVTAVSGRTLTLELTTDASLTYPRVVQVTRWTDVSSLVGRYLLQADSSEITSLVTLRNWIVVCRTTGFYLGRYTGDPGAPFVFSSAYQGSNVPLWPDAIANVKGDYLLYPARGNRMCRYDGTTWPQIHEVTDDASSLFFGTDDQTDEIYAVENPITKEWWFCYPDRTIAFDFDTAPSGTVSKIDQNFDAACAIIKPGTTDVWFVMAIGRFIYTYGLAYGAVPIQTWLRDGVAAEGVIKFGLCSFGDESNEKMALNYTPILSSLSPNADLEVQIYSAWNPSATPVALLSPVESLPSPMGRNFIPLAFQSLYFQDEITVVEATDIDVRIVKRIWEVDLVKAGGVTRFTDA